MDIKIYKRVDLPAIQLSPQVPRSDKHTFPQLYKLGLNLTLP